MQTVQVTKAGTTNTITWDFETSQNMIVAWADRQWEAYQVATIEDAAPNRLRTSQTELYNPRNDTYTKYEVPKR